MTTQPRIRTMTSSEEASSIEQTIDAITSAFARDAASRWVWPDDRVYNAAFPDFVQAFGGRAFAEETAYCLDGYIGAALWLPPGIQPDEEALAALLGKSVSAERLPSVLAVFGQMGAYHPHEPHWHLPLVGVRPEHQGKGLGFALLAPALAQCDRERIVAYLEATSPHNMRLYERLGFRAMGAIPAGPSASIVPMIRVPR